MAGESDIARAVIQVQFREVEPLYKLHVDIHPNYSLGKTGQNLSGALSPWPDDKSTVIRDKFLYVFSSNGGDFGLNKDNLPIPRSRLFREYAFQHMAPLKLGATNPGPSGSTPPEVVEKEVYFDDHGTMWELDLRKLWDRPRHERPHPKYGRHLPNQSDRLRRDQEIARNPKLRAKGKTWLRLELLDGKNGPQKRYFFFLSPVRLGPEAFRFAKSRNGVDALTFWFNYDKALYPSEKGLVAYTPDDHDRIFPTIYLVDPWAYARAVRMNTLLPALVEYGSFISGLKKKTVLGLSASHLDEKANGGSIDQLYLLASLIQALRGNADFARRNDPILDTNALDEVIGAFGLRMHLLGNACELAAQFISNWMKGPAHRLVDTTVTKDCEDVEDPDAAIIKGHSLHHWYLQTQLMLKTATGALFLTDVLSDDSKDFPSPIRDILCKYDGSDRLLDSSSTDAAALQMVDEVPDLALYDVLRTPKICLDDNGQPDLKKAKVKADALVNLLTNIGYFDADKAADAKAPASGELKDPRRSAQTTWSGKHKYYIKAATTSFDAWFQLSKGTVAEWYSRKVVFKGHPGIAFEQLASEVRLQGSLGSHLKTLSARQMESDLEVAIAQSSRDEALRRFRGLLKSPPVLPSEIRRQLNAVETSIRKLQAKKANLGSPPGDPKRAVEYWGKSEAIDQELGLRREEQLFLKSDMRDAQLAMAGENTAGEVADAQRAGRDVSRTEAQLSAATKRARQLEDLQTFLRKQAEAEAQAVSAGKQVVKAAKLFGSIATVGLEAYFMQQILADPNSTEAERVYAGCDGLKALADLGRDVIKFAGVDEVSFAELAGESQIAKLVQAPFSAPGLLWIFGYVGGLYTAGKYVVKAKEAWRMNDYSVVAGAVIASSSGVLTAFACVGVTFGLGLPGVGLLAALLVVAGVLIISFTTDDEWDSLIERCYFASGDKRNRRARKLGSTDYRGQILDEATFSGSGDCAWPVRSQLTALERLMARFSVRSHVISTNWPMRKEEERSRLDPFDPKVRGVIMVEFQYLPAASDFSMSLEGGSRLGGSPGRSLGVSFSYRGPALAQGAIRNGNTTIGLHALECQPGYVCWSIDELSYSAEDLRVRVDLDLADGSRVTCTHSLIKLIVDQMHVTPKFYLEENTEVTFARTFANVYDTL